MDPTQIPLRDLHLPEMIGWWPLAPGWWFLIVLAAAGLGYLLYQSFMKWRRNAARRVALRELARIQSEFKDGVDEISLAIELSELGGLTQKEAAERVGLSVPGMKARVQRGRRKLREALLDCCRVEVDRRGGVVDYEFKGGDSYEGCGCGDGKLPSE